MIQEKNPLSHFRTRSLSQRIFCVLRTSAVQSDRGRKKNNPGEEGYNTHFGAKKQALFMQKRTFLNFNKKRRKKTQWKAYLPERKMNAHDGT